ncbi:hypothetical protein ACIRBX_25855 [Kitasatospora sp. NPDC096147]|uniref:hypothetical protein n=1 Tax=Kitasatospora sp. NPDC096147 TaxID=3364093 RepID=UPI00381BB753
MAVRERVGPGGDRAELFGTGGASFEHVPVAVDLLVGGGRLTARTLPASVIGRLVAVLGGRGSRVLVTAPALSAGCQWDDSGLPVGSRMI